VRKKVTKPGTHTGGAAGHGRRPGAAGFGVVFLLAGTILTAIRYV
jgi:hypothetical protein